MTSDGFTKVALVIRAKRKPNSTDLFILRGPPEFTGSDYGAEFIAKKVRAWTGSVSATMATVTPGAPSESG